MKTATRSLGGGGRQQLTIIRPGETAGADYHLHRGGSGRATTVFDWENASSRMRSGFGRLMLEADHGVAILSTKPTIRLRKSTVRCNFRAVAASTFHSGDGAPRCLRSCRRCGGAGNFRRAVAFHSLRDAVVLRVLRPNVIRDLQSRIN